MNTTHHQSNHKYLLWPLAVLTILTFGVFLTTREVPNQQDIRSRAQVEQEEVSVTPSSEPTNQPGSSVLTISFTLPGISSRGGNLKPLHPTREVTLFFYDTDTNTADMQVKPIYTVNTTATFDANPQSPTYTKFVNKNINVNEFVKEGEYQVGIKTNQLMMKVYKLRDVNLSGIRVPVGKFSSYDMPFGSLIPGDIVPAPQGDNTIDIADYNEFMNCFGELLNTDSCTSEMSTDLDDNGTVDGIDYNILLRSFQLLLSLGVTVPTTTPSVSPTIVASPTISAAPVEKTATANNTSTLIMVLVVFLIFVAGILMFFRSRIDLSFLPFGSSDKEYFVKQDEKDEEGWFTLADDNGQIRGHYTGGKIKDGFARIQGEMKSDGKNKYLEISKIVWEDKD